MQSVTLTIAPTCSRFPASQPPSRDRLAPSRNSNDRALGAGTCDLEWDIESHVSIGGTHAIRLLLEQHEQRRSRRVVFGASSRFDTTRDTRESLVFGSGPDYCPGEIQAVQVLTCRLVGVSRES